MKLYKENTLRNWKKEELIAHILCLQHNLLNEEQLNNHMYKTVTQAMHNNPAIANEISKVLDVWNSSCGHRYSNGWLTEGD
jgi:hypothetical protein